MKTDDLIRALGADAKAAPVERRPIWALAVIAATVIAALVFFSTIGLRPDIMQAAHTMRFLFKFVFTGVLFASAFPLVRMLSVPALHPGKAALWLLAAPLLMAGALVLEMIAVPSAGWMPRLVGHNMPVCLSMIPLIGLGPLAVFIAVLRGAAPTRPVLAGAVAGIAAGGLAATFYAAHCIDDSPLFVATWYTIAITFLAALGAAGGRLFARW
jgi:hypothetical protein